MGAQEQLETVPLLPRWETVEHHRVLPNVGVDVQEGRCTQLAAAAGTAPRDKHPVPDAGDLDQQLNLVVTVEHAVEHSPPERPDHRPPPLVAGTVSGTVAGTLVGALVGALVGVLVGAPRAPARPGRSTALEGTPA